MGILIGIISFALGALAGVTVSALCTAASEESRRHETEAALAEARLTQIDKNTPLRSESEEAEPTGRQEAAGEGGEGH